MLFEYSSCWKHLEELDWGFGGVLITSDVVDSHIEK